MGEVLWKLVCIVKTREDGTLSGYNDGVQLKERIVLPRVKDLVEDVCELKRCAVYSEDCCGMVADFEDAFTLNASIRASGGIWSHVIQ